MKKIQITARTRAPEPITQSVLDKAIERGKMRHNTDKAIRLADALRDSVETDGEWSQEQVVAAAAELRRLAEVEGEWMALSQDQGKLEGQIDRLVTQRNELLEALRRLSAENEALRRERYLLLGALKSTRAFINSVAPYGGLLERVNAAIKAVEENT